MNDKARTRLHERIIRFDKQARPDVPRKVYMSDCGQVVVDDNVVFPNLTALLEVFPGKPSLEEGEDSHEGLVPRRPVTFTVSFDWADVHHALAEIDRQRRTETGEVMFGNEDGLFDIFGGVYWWGHAELNGTLDPLVRTIRNVDELAHRVWMRARDGIEEDSRHACRVARAIARARVLFHAAGLAHRPDEVICGTGRAYGLNVPRLGRAPSTADVDAYADGY